MRPPSFTPRSFDASESFALLLSRSEYYRIIAINAFAMLLLFAGALRSVIVPDAIRPPASLIAALLALNLIGAGLILVLRAMLRRRRAISPWMLTANAVFEGLLPTILIAMLWLSGTLHAAQALAAPAVMAYALVLILAPLRLNPPICILIGALSAVGHSALVALTAGERAAAHSPQVLPSAVLYLYGPWILVGGFAAAFVASQIRRHVQHVLAEAGARQHAEREIAVAAEIQQGLLPASAPDFPGFDIAFWSRPADSTGGDYYDWQLLPDGRLAVSLADVSGHGLGPALMAAFCRAYARATLDGESGLPAALRRVNTMLSADLPPGRFVTFAVALLAPGSPMIELVSAGHGPILVHRAASRTVESFPATGVPLGISPDEHFDPVARIQLARHDALVLITDGFFEWADPTLQRFGIERLKEALAGAPLQAAPTIAALRDKVEAFASGAPQTDDLSAVVLRFHPRDGSDS